MQVHSKLRTVKPVADCQLLAWFVSQLGLQVRDVCVFVFVPLALGGTCNGFSVFS